MQAEGIPHGICKIRIITRGESGLYDDMSDKLHQLNVSYVEKEDRLLLRATTRAGEEYRVWLTRRFTILLFDVLNKAMDKKGGAVSVGSRRQTRQMFKAGALEREFEAEKTTSYPLGEAGILACMIRTGTGTKDAFHLELLPEEGRGITLNLDQSLMYMFHNILTQGVARAGWQLYDETSSATGKTH